MLWLQHSRTSSAIQHPWDPKGHLSAAPEQAMRPPSTCLSTPPRLLSGPLPPAHASPLLLDEIASALGCLSSVGSTWPGVRCPSKRASSTSAGCTTPEAASTGDKILWSAALAVSMLPCWVLAVVGAPGAAVGAYTCRGKVLMTRWGTGCLHTKTSCLSCCHRWWSAVTCIRSTLDV
jgi:hypothetical protein